MQSHSCAAPRRIAFSISVTSAPRRTAVLAAEFPPGPPPMITNFTAMPRTYPGATPVPANCVQKRGSWAPLLLTVRAGRSAGGVVDAEGFAENVADFPEGGAAAQRLL